MLLPSALSNQVDTATVYMREHIPLTAVSVLILGKFLDVVSTIIGLTLVTNLYESVWYTRMLIVHLGLIPGNIVAFLTIVIGFIVYIEGTAWLIRSLSPSAQLQQLVRYYQQTLYVCGGLWYTYWAIHNFSFLF